MFADTGVRTVIAHTLAHRNASNRVLEKAGFHHDAETVQDGEVIWRFSSHVRVRLSPSQ